MKDIRIIVISDVHLGNRRNKTEYILDSLYTFFKELSKPETIDAIFISGDLFDTLLDFNNPDAVEIVLWMNWLMEYSAMYAIILRILEGTPRHDWKQSKWFATAGVLSRCPVDFKYVNTLSIETLPINNLKVLYIPDEWSDETKTTYEQALQLLKDNNLSQVDLIVMHGQFEFQIPKHLVKVPVHKSEWYIPLAKYFTIVGHVHIHSSLENIIVPGSFDRISHNEEEPKGGLELNITDSGKSFNFLENKLARTFKTIPINTLDIEKTYKTIEKVLTKVKPNSFIRLRVSKNHPILSNFKNLSIKYPSINWSHVLDKEETDTQSLYLDNNFTKYNSISINKENILDLVESTINEQNISNKDVLLNTLKEVIESI